MSTKQPIDVFVLPTPKSKKNRFWSKSEQFRQSTSQKASRRGGNKARIDKGSPAVFLLFFVPEPVSYRLFKETNECDMCYMYGIRKKL